MEEKNTKPVELFEEMTEEELSEVVGGRGNSFKVCKDCGKPLITTAMHKIKYGHDFVE